MVQLDDQINGLDYRINGADIGINGADSISLGEGVNCESSEGYKINGVDHRFHDLRK